jgi:hypothetical protein
VPQYNGKGLCTGQVIKVFLFDIAIREKIYQVNRYPSLECIEEEYGYPCLPA